MFKRLIFLVASSMIILGCGTTQQFVAVPKGLDRANVRGQVIEMKAKHYEFIPEVVKVKAGTLVTLRITAVDGTHGFALGAFGIDERIEEGETKVIEFYASKPGEYGFHCSHFCGLGHLGMKGKVLVE
jgi:heme/copper-type cytochrome/quinol oxidase subunit 2